MLNNLELKLPTHAHKLHARQALGSGLSGRRHPGNIALNIADVDSALRCWGFVSLYYTPFFEYAKFVGV
jgi:hypothetical protein